MFNRLPTWLWVIIGVIALAIIINPYQALDILLFALLLLILGQILLQEKLILVFLIIRPTLDYWRDISIFHYQNLSLNLNAALAILFLIWSAWILTKYWPQLKKLPLLLVFSLFTILTFVSTFYSVSPFTTLIESVKLLSLVTFFYVTYILIKNNKLKAKELLLSIIISALIPLLIGLLQIFTGSGLSTFGLHGRIYGTFAHPNVFAFFTLFLLFLHTHYSTIQPAEFWQKHVELKWLTYILLTALLLFTYTRAALVGLLVFFIIIGIRRYKKMLIWLIASLTLFYLLFYPLNAFLIKNYNYSLQQIPLLERVTSRNEEADSIAWRQSLLRETLPLIQAQPFLGYGYGTFPIVWEANRSSQHQWDDSAEAHNDYLRILLELGLLGLILYLLLLAKLVYRYKHSLYLFAWLAVFIVLGLSDNMLHHTPVMWLMWSWWGGNLES